MNFNRPVSRRQFLRGSALTLAAVCLNGCLGQALAPTAQTRENYYLKRKDNIFEDFKSYKKQLQKITTRDHSEALAAKVFAEADERFERLLAELPDIGGNQNKLTQTLCQCCGVLAFYQAMKTQSIPVDEIGRITYRAFEALSKSNDPLNSVDQRQANSQAARDYYRQLAEESRQRANPDDWRASYVEGDGVNFDYGIDYVECAVCKFFNRQNASEYTPYLCLNDFPLSYAFDTGLVRTSTLASGGQCCDFRFKTGRKPQMEWTPAFLKQG